MIPYFIRLSERTGNDQESSSQNIRSSNLNNSPNLQVYNILKGGIFTQQITQIHNKKKYLN